MDTNAGIDLLEGRFSPNITIWFDNQIYGGNMCVSVINKIELLGFKATPKNAQDLQDLVNNVEILSLSDAIVQ